MSRLLGAFLVICAYAAVSAQAPQPTPRKRVLALADTHTGYTHDSIGHALAVVDMLGRQSGLYDTFIRTDSQWITKQPIPLPARNTKNLNDFDAVFLFISGEGDWSDQQKKDFVSFVKEDGKGVVGAHTGNAAFYQWEEFGEMMGGYFDNHPWGIFEGRVVVDAPEFPAMRHFAPSFTRREEFYVLREKPYSRNKVRVLAHLDAEKLDLKHPNYHRKDADLPVALARTYGKGRTFWSNFGHHAETWDDPDIQKMYLEAIKWAIGMTPVTRLHRRDADVKLLRYGPPEREKPAMLDSKGGMRDLSGIIPDLSGAALQPQSIERLRAIDPSTLPRIEDAVRIAPCVGGVGKFICIGLNYSDHAAESGMAVPAEPILFMKATSAICGPNDGIIIPRGSKKTDWEVELGVIIGSVARYVTEAEALSHVAGYCVINDLSERAFQLEGTGQWVKGKSADTFGPIGPWLVTRDEVPDPQNLDLWLEVDGRTYQRGTTSHMIFGVARLVSYISRFMSLHPGDIISTGTPPGIGMGQKPEPIYLRPGNHVRLGIEGLGEQKQAVTSDD